MNGTLHMNRETARLNRLMKWPLLCWLVVFGLLRPVSGQINPIYDNETSVGPSPAAAQVGTDATIFLNNGSFTVDFLTSPYLQLFETQDTLYFTNNGTMIGNNGYLFDTYTTSSSLHSWASTFNNAGTIRCGASIDGNLSADGFPPELIVQATNIVDSGSVTVGQYPVITGVSSGTNFIAAEAGGLIQFTGQNIDLTRSTLTVEGLNSINSTATGVSSTDGAFGTSTNWEPDADLAPTYAYSSAPYYLDLANSTSYYTQAGVGTSNVVTRMVFVQNANPLPYNVYIGSNGGVGTGEATIEWVGSYLDSSTGNTLNNYLYLNDDYAQGSRTNVGINADGVPGNFAIAQSTTRIIMSGLQTSAFPTGLILPAGSVVTNSYSYATVQIIDTTVNTSNVVAGLTNIPGRVQINAGGLLNLSLASFTGLNYMSVTATNQYNGSTGARIFSPFSDINIGVTNGFMVVSNLTESSIPLWSGTVQCWSGRWFSIDTNGVTNDFRVLIVGTQIQPTSPSQVQDMILHATNSAVISDTYNISRTFSINSQNLTLTTNAVGVGAESLDGELNLLSTSLYWSNCVPNLRNLTNYGAIRLQNLATFGSPLANYYNFINTGTVSDQGAQVWANNFISSGTFANGTGSFTLQSTNAVLVNETLITTNGNVSIASGSLVMSNIVLQAGRSLTLSATNLGTDTGVNSGNFFTVGAVAISGQSVLSLPVKPVTGDWLGTTITNIAPTNKNVIVTWSGNDYGVSTAGFTNNAAVGRLILDSLGTAPQNAVFTFNGIGVSNAIYVDYLELDGAFTNESSYDFTPMMSINTNITIYFGQAMLNGVSVAEKIDQASRYNGKNNGRLRWVPTYAGHFSSTNIVYPGGITNTVNAALAASPDIDSNGNGLANGNPSETTPFFLASQVNFKETLTNVPPLSVKLTWMTIPLATNFVYFKTNLLSTNWMQETNFVFASANYPVLQTNSGFVLTNYPSPATNISILDPVNLAQPRYYRVVVQPWLTYPY